MAQAAGFVSGGWWAGIRNRAANAVEKQQAAFALGKVAGATVTDDRGATIVEAGQRIDSAIIALAYQSGRVAALGASALQAHGQDLREMVHAQVSRTAAAQESNLLDTVEEFAEIHNYLGRATTIDVTDLRGAVLIPAGKVLESADAQLARSSGQLGALLMAARQSVPASPVMTPPSETYPAPAARSRTLLGDGD